MTLSNYEYLVLVVSMLMIVIGYTKPELLPMPVIAGIYLLMFGLLSHVMR